MWRSQSFMWVVSSVPTLFLYLHFYLHWKQYQYPDDGTLVGLLHLCSVTVLIIMLSKNYSFSGYCIKSYNNFTLIFQSPESKNCCVFVTLKLVLNIYSVSKSSSTQAAQHFYGGPERSNQVLALLESVTSLLDTTTLDFYMHGLLLLLSSLCL